MMSFACCALAIAVFTQRPWDKNCFILAAIGSAIGAAAVVKSPRKPLSWLALAVNCVAAGYFFIMLMGLV